MSYDPHGHYGNYTPQYGSYPPLQGGYLSNRVQSNYSDPNKNPKLAEGYHPGGYLPLSIEEHQTPTTPHYLPPPAGGSQGTTGNCSLPQSYPPLASGISEYPTISTAVYPPQTWYPPPATAGHLPQTVYPLATAGHLHEAGYPPPPTAAHLSQTGYPPPARMGNLSLATMNPYSTAGYVHIATGYQLSHATTATQTASAGCSNTTRGGYHQQASVSNLGLTAQTGHEPDSGSVQGNWSFQASGQSSRSAPHSKLSQQYQTEDAGATNSKDAGEEKSKNLKKEMKEIVNTDAIKGVVSSAVQKGTKAILKKLF